MKVLSFVGAVALAASFSSAALASPELATKSGCLACHALDKKVIGPSYKDVAKKYAGNDKNVKMLAEKIIKGGQGNWGEIPMAGHPNISQEDAEAMVRYILTVK